MNDQGNRLEPALDREREEEHRFIHCQSKHIGIDTTTPLTTCSRLLKYTCICQSPVEPPLSKTWSSRIAG